MLWLYIAVAAYFINAISFVIDKHLLAAPIPQPFAYATGVALLSVAALTLVPFGIVVPDLADGVLSLISGGLFFCAIIFFYRSVRQGDVTVSATKAGLFTVLFSYVLFFAVFERLPQELNLYAIAFFAIGILFLGLAGRSILHYSVLAGACFALSFLVLKVLFLHLGFINGLFWSRMGFVLAAFLPLTMSVAARREVLGAFSNSPVSSRYVFVLNKVLVAVGFVGLYYAISIAPPAQIVSIQALQGFQFVSIFLLTMIFGGRIRGLSSEVDKSVLVKKIFGIACVVLGFLSLFLT